PRSPSSTLFPYTTLFRSLGLEVALADGTLARLGSRCHKNKTGFDLHRLFVGSEGMLGIVTEATLKLLPLPPYRALLGVGFDSAQDRKSTRLNSSHLGISY